LAFGLCVWLTRGIAVVALPVSSTEKLRLFFGRAFLVAVIATVIFFLLMTGLRMLRARRLGPSDEAERAATPANPLAIMGIGAVIGSFLGVGLATVYVPPEFQAQAKATPPRAAAVARPPATAPPGAVGAALPASESFLERALKGLPKDSRCTNDAVHRKTAYVTSLVAQQDRQQQTWTITPTQVARIWDGDGLCNPAAPSYAADVAKLTDQSKGDASTSLYFGCLLSVPTYYSAGEYKRARYYLDFFWAVRDDLSRRPAWSTWIKDHDKDLRPLDRVDALLAERGASSEDHGLYVPTNKL
ncbi:MAG: hypothetical protein JO101_04030, partial [Candidatus Eremiobacteraeota bacterium]|nr:hypothetical protein [Candidatus Eremiobacteraeota bacterium]